MSNVPASPVGVQVHQPTEGYPTKLFGSKTCPSDEGNIWAATKSTPRIQIKAAQGPAQPLGSIGSARTGNSTVPFYRLFERKMICQKLRALYRTDILPANIEDPIVSVAYTESLMLMFTCIVATFDVVVQILGARHQARVASLCANMLLFALGVVWLSARVMLRRALASLIAKEVPREVGDVLECFSSGRRISERFLLGTIIQLVAIATVRFQWAFAGEPEGECSLSAALVTLICAFQAVHYDNSLIEAFLGEYIHLREKSQNAQTVDCIPQSVDTEKQGLRQEVKTLRRALIEARQSQSELRGRYARVSESFLAEIKAKNEKIEEQKEWIVQVVQQNVKLITWRRSAESEGHQAHASMLEHKERMKREQETRTIPSPMIAQPREATKPLHIFDEGLVVSSDADHQTRHCGPSHELVALRKEVAEMRKTLRARNEEKEATNRLISRANSECQTTLTSLDNIFAQINTYESEKKQQTDDSQEHLDTYQKMCAAAEAEKREALSTKILELEDQIEDEKTEHCKAIAAHAHVERYLQHEKSSLLESCHSKDRYIYELADNNTMLTQDVNFLMEQRVEAARNDMVRGNAFETQTAELYSVRAALYTARQSEARTKQAHDRITSASTRSIIALRSLVKELQARRENDRVAHTSQQLASSSLAEESASEVKVMQSKNLALLDEVAARKRSCAGIEKVVGMYRDQLPAEGVTHLSMHNTRLKRQFGDVQELDAFHKEALTFVAENDKPDVMGEWELVESSEAETDAYASLTSCITSNSNAAREVPLKDFLPEAAEEEAIPTPLQSVAVGHELQAGELDCLTLSAADMALAAQDSHHLSRQQELDITQYKDVNFADALALDDDDFVDFADA